MSAGRSPSVAVAVNDSRVSSSTVWLPISSSTGSLFAPTVTVMEIVSEAFKDGVPSSVTVIVAGNVPGP